MLTSAMELRQDLASMWRERLALWQIRRKLLPKLLEEKQADSVRQIAIREAWLYRDCQGA